MIDPAILFQLRLVPLFAGLAEADLRLLVEGAAVTPHAAGTELYREGDQVDFLYVVLDGHVELTSGRSVVEVARRGTVLGDAALFGDGRLLMGARAVTPSLLLAIPAAPFLTKLEDRFDMVVHMLSSMSFRLRQLVTQIAELKMKTTAQRLGSFLLSLAEAESGAIEVRFPYDKRLVAEELGMKPESLSRALAKLARLGVDSLPDNRVAIASIENLRAFCIEDDGS